MVAAHEQGVCVQSLTMVASLLLVASVVFSPDGSLIAAGGLREVTLTDSRGAELAKLAGQSDVVRALAFSHDGKLLATAGGAPARFGQIQIWDVSTRKLVREWRGHEDCIYAIAFSPDGLTIATGSYDKLVKLWDAATGNEIRTLKEHNDAVLSVAFSPNGQRLASASADRTVKVWDPATGRRIFTLGEATDAQHAVTFHPSGHEIAAGGADKTLRVWKITGESAELERSAVAHEEAILQVVYSTDGERIATSSADKSVKIWNAAKLTELQASHQPDWVFALAYAPDGRRVAAGGPAGGVVLVETK